MANLKLTPAMETAIEICPSKDSVTALSNHWEKDQIQLNAFWEIWKNEYLTSLCEKSPLYHKVIKGQASYIPKPGQLVIILFKNTLSIKKGVAKNLKKAGVKKN